MQRVHDNQENSNGFESTEMRHHIKKGLIAIIFTFSSKNQCIAILKTDLNSLHEDNNIDNKKFSERFNKY